MGKAQPFIPNTLWAPEPPKLPRITVEKQVLFSPGGLEAWAAWCQGAQLNRKGGGLQHLLFRGDHLRVVGGIGTRLVLCRGEGWVPSM